jgi:HAD superfamily hydrolase (TIGR01509 family)
METKVRKISWLLFDLGGVLVEVDQSRIFEGLSGITGRSPSEVQAGLLAHQPFWDQFIVSEFSDEQVAREVNKSLGSSLGTSEVVAALNAELGDVIHSTADLLPALKTKVGVGCLSNTNTLHWDRLLYAYDFMLLFDRRFASQIVGHAKPSHEIYRVASSNLGVEPSEILFFDDKIENVRAAQSLGWNARLYKNHAGLMQDLELFNLA